MVLTLSIGNVLDEGKTVNQVEIDGAAVESLDIHPENSYFDDSIGKFPEELGVVGFSDVFEKLFGSVYSLDAQQINKPFILFFLFQVLLAAHIIFI